MASQQTRQTTRVTSISHRVERLPLKLARAWHAANLTLPDGYPSGGGEHVSGGGISRPVEAALLGRERVLDSTVSTAYDDGDEVEVIRVRGMRLVDEQLQAIEMAITAIEAELSKLAAPLTRRSAPPRTNITECEACGRTVAGTPTDRLRSGYCDACRKAWARAGNPDRMLFQRLRHREVSAADHSKTFALDRDTAGIDVWSAGVQVTLVGELAAEYRSLQREHGRVPSDDVQRLVAAAEGSAVSSVQTALSDAHRAVQGD